MANLPSFSYKQLVKKLKKAEFSLKRQAAGSHEIWFNSQTQRSVTVPHHAGENFKKGILSAMIKDAGFTKEAFSKL